MSYEDNYTDKSVLAVILSVAAVGLKYLIGGLLFLAWVGFMFSLAGVPVHVIVKAMAVFIGLLGGAMAIAFAWALPL